MKSRQERSQTERKSRVALNLLFTAVVFCFFLVTMAIVGSTVSFLIQKDVLSVGTAKPDTTRLVLYVALSSVLLGSILSAFISRIPMKPVNRVINAMNRLASGDFSTRLRFGKWLGRNPVMKELSTSFNRMAEELEKTELLRSDFVNNFSHEFKTPIVSIAGFASLLKRGGLTDAQKEEYMDVIEEESMRLSAMATNVLTLSRVENQTILRNVTNYNLSEQIRSCVLLLENKWTRKNLDLIPEFEEVTVTADEEMLRQVWINLIDNAVKFSPEYGEVTIRIEREQGWIHVAVSNAGDPIPGEKQQRIFQKFYQADESHAREGNGIGLAVAKRIVDLHGGRISVRSGGSQTTFEVALPDRSFQKKTAV